MTVAELRPMSIHYPRFWWPVLQNQRGLVMAYNINVHKKENHFRQTYTAWEGKGVPEFLD